MFAIAVSLALTVSPAAAVSAAPASPAHPQAGRAIRVLVVRNLQDRGKGSLRAAIQAANHGRRRDVAVVKFSVRGVIRLASALPAVTRQMIIDGRTAPGYRAGGAPVVEVNFGRQPGLTLATSASHSAVLGLAVDNASGDGITLLASKVTLANDYVGLNLSGWAFGNGRNGIYVTSASSGNTLGLNPSHVSGAISNVISGNRASGLVLAGSSGNTVAANRIGTNAAGTAAIPNGRDGLRIVAGARNNEIGGTVFTDSATGQTNNPTGDKGTETPVFVVPPLGNQISGNRGSGVVIASGAADNMLNGNFVGTTAKGDGRLGNGGAGVWVDHAVHTSLTGCKFVNNPFVYYNVISANHGNGLRVTDSANTVVQGNFFGVGANNTALIGNGRNGILVDGDSVQTQVGGVIPLGNVSAANHDNGIAVTGRARGFTTFNTFGGLEAFKGAAPNGRNGVLITSTGGNNLVRTNVMSGNRGNGIELAGHARGVTVDPNIAGLNTDGKARLGNGKNGLLITGDAHGNVIGGNLRSVIAQNTFSGNRGYGVAITGRAHGNRVFRTVIGTTITGTTAIGNARGGVLIGGRAYANQIGMRGVRTYNLISGNLGVGVTLTRGTSHNLVIRNLIGLSRLRKPLPNSGPPILDRGRRNLIIGNRF
jgi:parallel beta-helix repeat protein